MSQSFHIYYLQLAEDLNRGMKEVTVRGLEPDRNSRGWTALDECQGRCDFATKDFQGIISYIDMELRMTRESFNIQSDEPELEDEAVMSLE